jgi:hypothetical protein
VPKATWFSIGVRIRKGFDRVLLIPRKSARGFERAIGALFRALPWPAALMVLFFGGCLAFFVVSVVFDAITRPGRPPNPQTVQTPTAERLARAKADCGSGSQCLSINEAMYQISKIPASAPEYAEASKLSAAIKLQVARENEEAMQKGDVEVTKNPDDPRELSWETAQKNFQGAAHDGFVCAMSTENQPIVSFDDRLFWWKDDGRCAEQLQRKKDEDAQASSYWPTTVRVNTDMDSFWLPQEERTCQTFPDDKGRVSIVTCDATAHANHNIPVKFWGGVDRDTVSNWKCRREKDIFSDEFVCRAID